MTTTIGSLCSGYGGLEMGISAAVDGSRVIWHAEVDPAASAVLARHHPDVPNLGSIIGHDWATVAAPDVLCAGFPCQPVSAAGRQLADADPRWLWPAVRDAIATLAPPVVFLENVRNIVSIQQGEIIRLIESDLVALGYSYRWIIVGACAVGACHHRHRWFLRADRAEPGALLTYSHDRTARCGARRGAAILPTPTARDGDARRGGEGDAAYWAARAEHRTNGKPLGAAMTLLPTPTVALSTGGGVSRSGARIGEPLLGGIAKLLPTPRAADQTGGKWEGDSRQGAADLRTVTALLPSLRASDGDRGRGNPNQHGGRGDLMIGSAVQPERFGAFGPAVERQALAFGAPPPEPTTTGENGNQRLSAGFAEWMMGLPAGYVTNGMNRSNALRLLGNGAVPQQVAAAWYLLDPNTPMEGTQTMTDNAAPEAPEQPRELEPATEAPPYDIETSLGGTTRRLMRAASPVVEEIRKVIEFHTSADGVHSPAQAVREVLGTIARAADEASKHRPRNRAAPEHAELNPAALRQLAALMRVYQGAEESDPSAPIREAMDAMTETQAYVAALPDATLTVTGTIDTEPVGGPLVDVDAVAAEVARIEAGLIAQRDAKLAELAALGQPAPSPNGHVDPFDEPAPLDPWAGLEPDQISARIADGVNAAAGIPDPFDTPAPIGYGPGGSQDDIPF